MSGFALGYAYKSLGYAYKSLGYAYKPLGSAYKPSMLLRAVPRRRAGSCGMNRVFERSPLRRLPLVLGGAFGRSPRV